MYLSGMYYNLKSFNTLSDINTWLCYLVLLKLFYWWTIFVFWFDNIVLYTFPVL